MIENAQKSNYKGRINYKALAIVVATFLLVKFLFVAFTPTTTETRASDLTTENILKAVNEQRSLRNLVTLNTNSKLGAAAQSKSDDMQARHYFAHVDPDGKYIWDKIVQAGYSPYLQLGENLAIEFYDTESLVSAWMNSPTHRENILNDGFHEQGMGLALGTPSQGQYYSAITNTFGAQSAPKPTPTPKPVTTPKPTPTKISPTPTPNPQPTTVKTTPTPTKSPTPTPKPSVIPTTSPTQTPSPTPTYVPVEIRPTKIAENVESNFKVPDHNESTSSPTSTIPSNPTSPGIIGVNEDHGAFSDSDINRYLILICGIMLLFLVLSDIKQAVEEKLSHLDKKTNNLIVLIFALIVIAFMYWL